MSKDAKAKGDWVTNIVGDLRGYWPRRDAKLTLGDPYSTGAYTLEQLKIRRIKGVYLDEDIPEGIRSRPLIQRPS